MKDDAYLIGHPEWNVIIQEATQAVEDESEHTQIGWCIADVYQQAEEDGEELTEKEAKEVISLLDRKHDATIGVNWDTISYWIGEVVAERNQIVDNFNPL